MVITQGSLFTESEQGVVRTKKEDLIKKTCPSCWTLRQGYFEQKPKYNEENWNAFNRENC